MEFCYVKVKVLREIFTGCDFGFRTEEDSEMENPTISVVIPTKCGDNIQRTIESVLNQTYKDTEIIVVDDNGRGTEEQIQTETRLSKYVNCGVVKYCVLDEHKNGAFARNVGFAETKGKYIQYMDDDDILLPTKLETELTYLQQHTCDMVACGAFFINAEKVGYVEKPKMPGTSEKLLLNYLTGKYMFNTSTWLVSRKVVEKLNGFDDSFLRHQDWEFCLRIMANFKVELISEPLVIKTTGGRNKVRDAEESATLKEYFLETRKPDMLRALGERNTRKVFDYHYKMTAIAFVGRDYKRALEYIKKCNHPSLSIWEIVIMAMKLYLRKQIIGHKEVTDEELCNLM